MERTVGGIGASGRDYLNLMRNFTNRTAHPCAPCDIPFILNIIAARTRLSQMLLPQEKNTRRGENATATGHTI